MERLRCVVERVTYQNEKTGYSVIKCRVRGFNDLVTVVGNMPEVHIGAVLTLTGTWKVNPKFGRQFTAETFEETLPVTVHGIEKYLGSALVKGIGPKFAQRIVRQFGAETLNVIEEDPDVRRTRYRESPGGADQKELGGAERDQEPWMNCPKILGNTPSIPSNFRTI